MRLASLPWYDLHEVEADHDALWSAIAVRLRAAGVRDVPNRLERQLDYSHQWASGRLLLGQACGYDVVMQCARSLRVVATPCFAFEGCDGPRYRSFVVVRRADEARTLADLRGRRCVINTETSHSGMNVLRQLIAPLHRGGRFFGRVLVSGAHERSMEMVATGDADVAAIDCITYGLLARHRPDARCGLRILCRSRCAPAPPFVTSASTPRWEVEALRTAIREAIADLSDANLEALGIRGARVLPVRAYQPLAETAHRTAAYREMAFHAA